jgi:hypothetical protein
MTDETQPADILDVAPAADAAEGQPKADNKAIFDDKPDVKPVDQKAENVDKGDQAGDLLSDDGASGDEGVPDQYTFDAPDGSEVDQERLDQFGAFAKELGITQNQYQKLVEFELQRTQEATEAAVSIWNTRVDAWRQASLADKEIGGQSFEASKGMAKNAVNQFADPDFRALLKSPTADNPEGLALSNNPAMLRFLTRIGKVLAEPSLLDGSGAPTPSQDAWDRMYPSMRKETA